MNPRSLPGLLNTVCDFKPFLFQVKQKPVNNYSSWIVGSIYLLQVANRLQAILQSFSLSAKASNLFGSWGFKGGPLVTSFKCAVALLKGFPNRSSNKALALL